MTRGVRQGVLTSSDLRKRLGLNIKDNRKFIELLKACKEDNKITNEEYILSIPLKESTIKCYLYSIVTDEMQRTKIEEYVQMASLLYTRGSFIANLLALKELGAISGDANIPKYNFKCNNEVLQFAKFIENDNFKQCFLPERWPSGKEPRNPSISTILTENSHLNNILPAWQDIMSVSGWDNVINRMYSKYRANIQNHVMVHLPKHLDNYLKTVELEEPIYRDALISCFKRLKPIVAHNEDFEFIMQLRIRLGILEVDQYFPKKFEYCKENIDLFMFFVKHGVTKGNYLPLSGIERKYCYIDSKVIRFMFPDLYKATKQRLNRDPLISDILDINPESFRRRRKSLRQKLRKEYRGKNNKRLKKKWNRLGRSNMPINAKIFSIETDGVGLSICIQRPMDILDEKKPLQNFEIDPKEKPVMVGIDFGRAKSFAVFSLFGSMSMVALKALDHALSLKTLKNVRPAGTAAISSDPIKKPETIILTRRQYYFDIKHRIRMKWEKQRSNMNPIKDILIQLSINGGKGNLLYYIQTFITHIEELKKEYLFNKERALWKMRLYRLKKKSLDKHVQKIFKIGKGRPIVLGLGDAKFLPTGRHEKSMPTSQIVKTFIKAKYNYNNKVCLKTINEFSLFFPFGTMSMVALTALDHALSLK
jgi:hypothetical protein